MAEAVINSNSTSTDFANWLVEHLQFSFREAYQLVGLGWVYSPTTMPVLGTFIDVLISFNFFQVSSYKFFKFSIKKLRSFSLSIFIFLKVSFFILSIE